MIRIVQQVLQSNGRLQIYNDDGDEIMIGGGEQVPYCGVQSTNFSHCLPQLTYATHSHGSAPSEGVAVGPTLAFAGWTSQTESSKATWSRQDLHEWRWHQRSKGGGTADDCGTPLPGCVYFVNA